MERTLAVVSSTEEHVSCLAGILQQHGLHVEHVGSLERFRGLLAADGVNVVLTEVDLPDGTWRDVLATAQNSSPSPPVLITSRHADAHFWADILEAGAYDLITQPFHAAEVQRLVLSAFLKTELNRKENAKVGALIARFAAAS